MDSHGEDVYGFIELDPTYELPTVTDGNLSAGLELLTAEELASMNLPEGWEQYPRLRRGRGHHRCRLRDAVALDLPVLPRYARRSPAR